MGLDKAGKSMHGAQAICPSGKIALIAVARNGIADGSLPLPLAMATNHRTRRADALS
jgi:hypothetical protein